ncbi:MAG TPA: class I adenylate-forming enzyme family protein [Pseudonocardia sp.]|nr:class I adenylate-forming enzyme family protein [Pseudonocardia sp.]
MPAPDQSLPVLRPARLDAGARSAARRLAASGVTADHRVLLAGRNTPGFAFALLGLMRLGASIALSDPALPAAHTVGRAREVAADVVVADPDICDSMARAARWARPPIPVPALCADPGPPAAPDPDPELSAWSAREDALVAYTSGSTGDPKPVVRTGRSVVDNIARTAAVMGYERPDLLAPLLPYSHQYGMSIVLLAATTGAGLLVVPARRLDLALPALAAHRASVVDATPATYRTLLRLASRRPGLARELGSVRMWCSGGAPLDEALASDFPAFGGTELLDGYGSTELGNVALATPDDPRRCLPLPGVGVSVVDDRGTAVPAGTVGEVVVDTPDRSLGVLVHGRLRAGEAGPVRTGDIGAIDATGSLRVIGRTAAVHRNGHTLYPDQISAAAASCGAQVHVAAVPDAERGCRLVLFVEDDSGAGHHEWWRRLRAVLGEHEMPNRVLVLERLPLAHNGKVDRQRLHRLAVAAVGPVPAPRTAGSEPAPVLARSRQEAPHGA